MKANRFLYQGRKTKEISFPLGGLGTGCIGLAGNGRLVDWEIFNKPNKQSVNGFSHFAIKAEKKGKTIDARVLNGDLHPPYMGAGSANWTFGFGPRRETMAGVPHFRSVDFLGQFPITELAFNGSAFPGSVNLTAFNPFIPLNDRDSGIPAAFFEFTVKNTTRKTLRYTLAGYLNNPLPKHNVNTVKRTPAGTMLHLGSDGVDPASTEYGELTLATDAAETSWQQYAYGGTWFDTMEVYWRDFTTPGKLKNREVAPGTAGAQRAGIVAVHFTLKPGQSRNVRFVIAWNFPNVTNYWSKSSCECAEKKGIAVVWKNYYATLWKDSKSSAGYALKNWQRLFAETKKFRDALFASDLPPAALDAVSANLAVLKSATVSRLEDGTFYGFEGCQPGFGCCEGSCTHVWNYAQALPFLFPKLERSVRDADYRYNFREDGAMPFRIQLPLGTDRWNFRPCADGQFGGVMKVYRDWKICGDTAWLRELWPRVKKSIEFAWSPDNEDKWDPDKTGVLHGRQHHTLDVELFGPCSWTTGFYLGALKAGAEMAQVMGEPDTAREYREVFERGKAWTDRHLFNGEYYHQKIDLKDKAIVEKFKAADYYWSEEHGEIKYQIGEGLEIDQVLAQWHANLYGLGELFDRAQVKQALRSIFKYNYRPRMRDYFNACRLYCVNDEGGLVVAHWPEHVYRPQIPIPYAGETQNGYEYAAAIQMIQSGLVKEGMKCIEALRARYDGEKRNPWNEFECGSNYARSMASYALLNAFAGFSFDMTRGMIGFEPVQMRGGRFRCFWSLDGAWGEVEFTSRMVTLQVHEGTLNVKALRLGRRAVDVKTVKIADKSVAYECRDEEVRLKMAARIESGNRLVATMESKGRMPR